MQDLIERLEKATGPDRQLDAAIWVACFCPEAQDGGIVIEPKGSAYASRESLNTALGSCWVDECSPALLCFTGSLDAARELARGFYWVASEGKTRESEPLGGAQIFRRDHLTTPLAEAEHEKVEIALCIAAVKARASLKTAE